MLPATRSIRHKLMFVVMATTLAALIVTGVSMAVYDLRAYRDTGVHDLATQADILGRSSAAALAFDDVKAARQNLALLKARPNISAAAIYTARGALFASYQQNGTSAQQGFPALPESEGSRIDGKDLIVFKRIVDNNEILGTVYLRARYQLFQRLKDYVGILGTVMLASLVVAGLMSTWLQSVVTKPIMAISDLTRRVMETRDYTLRARKTTQDEIGYLADGFNGMLAEIGRRAEELEASNRTLGREVAERRNTEETLRATERRNRTLIEAMTSVVWSADDKGRFGGEQPSWTEYTGQKYGEFSGLGWRSAIEADDRRRVDLAWAQALHKLERFELELKLWHEASRRYRYVNLRAVPIVEANGVVVEWIGTVTDIDDQRQAEAELRKLNAELERRVADRTAALEAANKELESFSYSVSHDLRAPLRAVTGFSRLLWDDHAGQLDTEARRKLDVIQSEARRMGMLIDDLLAFSRLGRKSIQPVELDMRELANGVFGRLQTQQPGPEVEFRLGLLPRGTGDRALLEQVWANFISNALKFSGKREKPAIEIGAISDQKEHIYFVRDNGVGFDPRYQSKLFGVFQRLHDSSEFPGTGVGLALVQRIVNRHGGRVWADSRPNEGATFYFTLPKEQANGAG